jgi:hypothetical protein
MARSNNRMQPTPLRGPKIVGILEIDFVLTLVSIYTAARLMRSVGRRTLPARANRTALEMVQ